MPSFTLASITYFDYLFNIYLLLQIVNETAHGKSITNIVPLPKTIWTESVYCFQLDQSECFVSLCFLPGKVYPSGVTFTTSNSWSRAFMWAAWNVDHLTLDVSFSRTDIFKNSFFVRICRLWNTLPLSIRESNTLLIFRKNLMAFYHDKFNVDFLNFYTVLY